MDHGALLFMCTDILKTIIQDICSYGIAHAYDDNVIYIRISWKFNIISTCTTCIYHTLLVYDVFFYYLKYKFNVIKCNRPKKKNGETIKMWFSFFL